MSSSQQNYKKRKGGNGGYKKPKDRANDTIQIDKQACSLQESNFMVFIEQLVDTVIKEVKSYQEKNSNGKKLKINLCLERNKINDVAIDSLVECLIRLNEYIDVDIIRLHMNSIHDDGFKRLSDLFPYFNITELHLSHNYITWEGFEYFYKSILSLDKYPLHSQKPLWLRLEYNQLDIKKLENLLSNKKALRLICPVKRRGIRKGDCNIKFCAIPPKYPTAKKKIDGKSLPKPDRIKLHIPYILYQKQSLKSLCNLSGLTSKSTTPKSKNDKRKKNSINESDESLLIVLDTCAIITMSSENDFFSFDNLLSMRKANLLADNIHFILVDTVFQQLDARKKETKKHRERIAIRHFVDDILSEATKENLLHYIHPMELEDEVRARGGHIGNQNFRTDKGKFDSDGLILDCAFYLMEQSPNNVLFLTEDIPCKARALINHLPAETIRELLKRLKKTSLEYFSRSDFLKCCTQETIKAFGDNKSNTNSLKPRGSLISELATATDLVQKLSILLSESLKMHENPSLQSLADNCFNDAQSCIDNWTQLINSHQQLKRISRDQKSSTSYSPSLFDSPDNSFREKVSEFSSRKIPLPLEEDIPDESNIEIKEDTDELFYLPSNSIQLTSVDDILSDIVPEIIPESKNNEIPENNNIIQKENLKNINQSFNSSNLMIYYKALYMTTK